MDEIEIAEDAAVLRELRESLMQVRRSIRQIEDVRADNWNKDD